MNAGLDAIGIDLIVERIANGESQREIAQSLGASPGELSTWLSRDPERQSRAREARAASAEAWFDRGFDALLTVDTTSRSASNDVSLAREIALHCRKVAAIRNPREYGDKIDVSGQIDHKHSVSELFKQIVSTPSLVGCIVPDEPEDAILLESPTKSDS